MFPLLECAIAFITLLLTLSYVVKAATSSLKCHLNYYANNLISETENILSSLTEQALPDDWKIKASTWLTLGKERMGTEFFKLDNFLLLMKSVGIKDIDRQQLESKLQYAAIKIERSFQEKMKNLAIVIGLVLCLGLNINAFSIWTHLYHDQNLRSRLSSPEYVTDLVKKDKELEQQINQEKEKKINTDALDNQRKLIQQQLGLIKNDYGFGVGKIWTDPKYWPDKDKQRNWLLVALYEFFGSLLTGLMASVGAPYWHDLLRALSKLRYGKDIGDEDEKTKQAASGAGGRNPGRL